MRDFNNLVDALNGLKKEGYVHDFNVLNDCIHCQAINQHFNPDSFNVEEILYFEGDDSSPDSRSILYVISTNTGEKGVLVAGNSIYDSDLAPELMAKLNIRK